MKWQISIGESPCMTNLSPYPWPAFCQGGCKYSPPTAKRLQGPSVFGETKGMGTPEDQGAQPQNIITLRWYLPCCEQETQDYRSDLMQTFTLGENNSLRSFTLISTANRYTLLPILIWKERKKSQNLVLPSNLHPCLKIKQILPLLTGHGLKESSSDVHSPSTAFIPALFTAGQHLTGRHLHPSITSWQTREYIAIAKNFMTLLRGLIGNLWKTNGKRIHIH